LKGSDACEGKRKMKMRDQDRPDSGQRKGRKRSEPGSEVISKKSRRKMSLR